MEDYSTPDIVVICFESGEFINESFTETPGTWGDTFEFDE